MEDESSFPDSDLDFSFTSSSARSSSTRSSLTLSFNESHLSTEPTSGSNRPHRHSDRHWTAIKTATTLSPDKKLHLQHLKLIRPIGSGNLGRVFLCNLKQNPHQNFALKVIDTKSLCNKKLHQVSMESQILSQLDHPFLPTLYAHFEASHFTCLLIDYCPNGDLHSLLKTQPKNRCPLPAVRFFAAEVLIALEYLHALGIVYRDLKPENVLLREDGHIMLSDFDLCFTADVVPTFETRKVNDDGEFVGEFYAEPTMAFSKTCVGTHEYLSPELVEGNGHGNEVDWWAFGVFVYELLYGKTPFKGRNKEETLRNIALMKEVKFPAKEKDEEGEEMAVVKDLIEKLLVKDRRRRLGSCKGATEIKRHRFFDGITWPLIRTYRPPEIRGMMKARHVAGAGCWKRIRQLLRKMKNGSLSEVHSNSNYYHYRMKSNRGSKNKKIE